MLKKLSVRNYILIDELDIHFTNGLTIITGETGAGKSILLGALSMILGQRADAGALLDKKKKCIIEGVFLIKDYPLQNFFADNELDYEEETCLRREITPEGKSRAFINDTPVNLSLLRELADTLVDIHSQHETLTLANSTFQLSVTDAFADNGKKLITYKKLYTVYRNLKKELEQLKAAELKAKADIDYFQFQFNELEEAKLKSGEVESLETELQSLTHAEEIKQQLNTASQILSGEDENILQRISTVGSTLSQVSKFDKSYEDLSSRIKSVLLELKDINAEAEQLSEQVRFDPMRADIVNERLNIIYRLQQKHHLNSVDDLLQLQSDLQEKLSGIGSLELQIEKMEVEVTKQFAAVIKLAKEISIARKKVLPEIEKSVKKLTAEMAMPNAELKVEQQIGDDQSAGQDGIDKITFLFSANKGGDFKELGKVASGGELSRLMLAIKSLMAGLTSLPTIIFDEIDTGISGEVAARVGGIMQEISRQHQVIAITHLPQIAGKGSSHLIVYKTDTKTGTRTSMRILTEEERINEIARMLSGNKISGAAIEHAKELLE
ncbi:MAG: DNA repair protein RecN [Bacteroidota bacterium]